MVVVVLVVDLFVGSGGTGLGGVATQNRLSVDRKGYKAWTLYLLRKRAGRGEVSVRMSGGGDTPRLSRAPAPRSYAEAFYAAPGSTIKAGGGLGTPDVTE